MQFRRPIETAVCAILLAACGGGSSPAPASVAPPTDGPSQAVQVTPRPTVQPTTRPDYVVVALGDSIPYNSPDDCPGCTSFVDLYAEALAKASGKTVAVNNMSEHTGLTVDRLLTSIDQNASRTPAIADADVVIVGIAHNDVPMARDDDSCDGAGGERPDWSKFTDACLQVEMDRFRPSYEQVFSSIAAIRLGRATVLRTINRYNDWNGWPGQELTPEGVATTAKVIAAWNEMLCAAAEKSGFVCADISTEFNGEDGTKPSADLLAGDYTHPSQKGNDVIAEVLIDLGFAPLL